MTIGVYIRVSTSDQKTSAQRAEIERWLKAHNHDQNNVEWFEDIESGARMSRDGLESLNAAIFAGDVKTVVIWKLDRIARSHKEGINTLYAWCDAGVRVVSVTQQIDLSGTVGKVVAGVLFGLAEIELTHIRERQAAGIADAKAKGVYRGRRSGTLKASPARAKELKAKGMKPGEIMKALGIKSRTTLSNYLKADR